VFHFCCFLCLCVAFLKELFPVRLWCWNLITVNLWFLSWLCNNSNELTFHYVCRRCIFTVLLTFEVTTFWAKRNCAGVMIIFLLLCVCFVSMYTFSIMMSLIVGTNAVVWPSIVMGGVLDLWIKGWRSRAARGRGMVPTPSPWPPSPTSHLSIFTYYLSSCM